MVVWLSAGFIVLGAIFMLIAGIGILRMPDLFLRMSAATIASTVGVGFVLLGVILKVNKLEVTAQLMATILFLFLTVPVGAHIIGRAAHGKEKVKLFEGTVIDELSDSYEENKIDDGTT